MNTQRIVIKVGSHVLTQDGEIARVRMMALIQLISELKSHKYEVILVSSGAVAAGFTRLPLDRSTVANKQALAAIGQPLLLKMYQEKFAKYNILCSQILLSSADLDSKKRTHLAQIAINGLLDRGIVPIINENDVIATEELVFGDNDQLSAYVTYNFDAELLVILSDIDAYYNKNPREYSDARALKIVSTLTEEEICAEVTPHGEFATGGIVTKLKSAHFLLERNKKMFLATGFGLDDTRSFLIDGIQKGGTLFLN